jgi:hypothetical protein
LQHPGGIDKERGYCTDLVFFGRVQHGLEVSWREDGVIVDHQEMGQVGIFRQSLFSCKGKTSTKTQIFFRGKKLKRNGGSARESQGGWIRAVIRDHHGDRRKSLPLQ